jgi:hypothetical protein
MNKSTYKNHHLHHGAMAVSPRRNGILHQDGGKEEDILNVAEIGLKKVCGVDGMHELHKIQEQINRIDSKTLIEKTK